MLSELKLEISFVSFKISLIEWITNNVNSLLGCNHVKVKSIDNALYNITLWNVSLANTTLITQKFAPKVPSLSGWFLTALLLLELPLGHPDRLQGVEDQPDVLARGGQPHLHLELLPL